MEKRDGSIFFVQEQQGVVVQNRQVFFEAMATYGEINVQATTGMEQCFNKCAYSFDYRASNSMPISNDQYFASAQYSSGSSAVFNDTEYVVTGLQLYAPSLHKFEGNKVDAELVALHVQKSGSGFFNVGIPIVAQSSSSYATEQLTNLVDAIVNKAPSQGSEAAATFSDFNLADLVPKTPYYSYTDPDANTEWVVFGLPDALMLSPNSIKRLKEVIRPYTVVAMGDKLSRNPNGPTVGFGNEIYIECNPVNSSEEQVPVGYATTSDSVDNSKLLESPTTGFFIKLMISCFLFVCVFLGVGYLYKVVFGPKKTPDNPLTSMFNFLGKQPGEAAATTS